MTFKAEQLGGSGTELASLLRDLRKRAGLSGDRLAARCNMSQSKVSRIENGRTRPSLVDVEQILRALDAPPGLVAEVSALARMANTEWRNLRELRRKGLGTRRAELKSLEASSTQMRYFLLSMVTGLLATPEYVRAFVLTEQAVRWPVVSPLALAEQMDRLASLSYLPNVQIGVIPVGAPTPRTPLSTFTIYDVALVTIETTAGNLVLRDGRDVQAYLTEFAGYEEHALVGEDLRARLAEWSAACRA
ncbi:Scr1 family TA system antitoxin-like transcriptional regulator [Streptomyces sp. AB3(2024)]|uniref:Scr1 family TA system antitoxin-like transcriptional regulator n=1 Tax=Streptomyces sp. AB3(2024) TaxID=3317321 RepID=UPI0035A2FE28